MGDEYDVEFSDKYRRMVYLLLDDIRYSDFLSNIVSSSDCEFICQALLRAAAALNCTQKIIRDSIQLELQKQAHTPHNIFRGNSLASKLLGVYVKNVSNAYLQLVIGDILKELILDKDLSLEIDIDKLAGVENAQEIIEANRKKLQKCCDRIIECIMKPEHLSQMPSEIRIVSSYIAQLSDSLKLNTPVVVGGYVMLRLFNPALVAPEAYGVVPPGLKTSTSQRNLILISKVIQNLSNNVLFGQKEPYMNCMNPFIEANMERINKYFLSTTAPGLIDVEKMEITPLDVEQMEIPDQKELEKLYQIIRSHHDDVLNLLQREAEKNGEQVNSDNEFLQLARGQFDKPNGRSMSMSLNLSVSASGLGSSLTKRSLLGGWKPKGVKSLFKGIVK